MSEEKGTFKGNGKIFELNFILSQIFLAEWTLSLITNLVKLRVLDHHLKCYKKKNMGEGRGIIRIMMKIVAGNIVDRRLSILA